MKPFVIIGILCLLLGLAPIEETLWQLHRMRGQGIGAVAVGVGHLGLLIPLGVLLLFVAFILSVKRRG